MNIVNNTLHLNDLISESDFQSRQDEIAVATNVAMITVDYSGKPVTSHSSCSEFCKLVRQNDDYRYLCEKCDSRGGVEAARLKKPYIYLCHMGLVDFAVPIIINDIYMGAVMAGQLRIKDSDKSTLERIVSFNSGMQLYERNLLDAFDEIPVMSLVKINALANIIFYLVNTLIKEILDMKPSMERINKIINIESLSNNNKAKRIILPAIRYIDDNYKSEINLNTVSELCGISSSYLSRLFKKVIGFNFAQYVNRVRINHAKRLLVTTNISIASLALETGYEDSGYFIKVFKRMEDITPNEYRIRYTSDNEGDKNFDLSNIIMEIE